MLAGMGVTDERVNLRGDVGTGGNNAGDLKLRLASPVIIRAVKDFWAIVIWVTTFKVASKGSSELRNLKAEVAEFFFLPELQRRWQKVHGQL